MKASGGRLHLRHAGVAHRLELPAYTEKDLTKLGHFRRYLRDPGLQMSLQLPAGRLGRARPLHHIGPQRREDRRSLATLAFHICQARDDRGAISPKPGKFGSLRIKFGSLRIKLGSLRIKLGSLRIKLGSLGIDGVLMRAQPPAHLLHFLAQQGEEHTPQDPRHHPAAPTSRRGAQAHAGGVPSAPRAFTWRVRGTRTSRCRWSSAA